MIVTKDFFFFSSFSIKGSTSVGAYLIAIYKPEEDIFLTSSTLSQTSYYLSIHSCARSRKASIDNKCQTTVQMLIIKRSYIYIHIYMYMYMYIYMEREREGERRK